MAGLPMQVGGLDYGMGASPGAVAARTLAAQAHVTLSEVDAPDKNTPDAWVKRDPRIVRLTGKHPLNCEPTLPDLFASGFITPSSLHYVRNHGAVPVKTPTQTDRARVWDEWRVTVGGNVTTPRSLSLKDLEALPSRELPVLLVCAGNRRKEQNMVKQTIGFSWGAAGCGTSVWRGCRLRDVLLHCGIKPKSAGSMHISMKGPAKELPKGDDGSYGTSITYEQAMDPAMDVLVAWEQNGRRLDPDHGYPVRMIIPGYIGGRMIKWLAEITVGEKESDNFYHYKDNRLLPVQVDVERADREGWWFKPGYIINELNVQSAIGSPGHGEIIYVGAGTPASYTVSGYAYSGGGRQVTRVEVSLDGGATWELTEIQYPEKPTEFGKYWCWCFWSHKVRVSQLARAKEIVVRAWDSNMNTQPGNLTWSVMGMMNNTWFRVRVHPHEDPDGAFGLVFEHPTRAGRQSGGWMVSDKTNDPVTEILGLAPNVTVVAPGSIFPPTLVTPDKEETITMKDESLPKSARLVPPRGERKIPWSEVRKHDSPEDPWIVVEGRVFDVKTYLKDHPGGADSVTMNAGMDATEEFAAIHSKRAWKLLEPLYIGDVYGSPDDGDGDEDEKADGEPKTKGGVTARDVVLVQATWEPVAEIAQAAGVAFFGNLFELAPGLLQYFPFKAEANLYESEALKAHALKVVTTIGVAVNGLDDLPVLVPILEALGKKHVGYGVLPEHYDAVGTSLIKTLSDNLPEDVFTANARTSWGKVYNTLKATMIADNYLPPPPALNRKKKVDLPLAKRIELTHDTRLLRFALPTKKHCLGLPVGKHFMLYAKVQGELVARAYTPTTSDYALGHVDLVIKVYFKNQHPRFPDGGKMSQHLDTLRVGDTISVKGPIGHVEYQTGGTLLLDGKPRNVKAIGFVAGGTGLTPCYQVITRVLHHAHDATRVCLLYANKSPDDILLKPELDALAAKYPDRFQLRYVVDEGAPDDSFSTGFVDAEMFKAYMPPPDPQTVIAFCGPPPMLKFAVRPSLIATGHSEENLVLF